MKWLVDNWTLLVVLASLVIFGVTKAVKFSQLSRAEQIESAKHLLLKWVAEAEAKYGGGTGIIKLRDVYEKFVGYYKDLAEVIPFETFSKWVDDALEEMDEILKDNPEVANLVYGTEENKDGE